MNDHLTPLRAAYVTQRQRTYRQYSRGIPTPEKRREWADDADALIAAHDRETAARAWERAVDCLSSHWEDVAPAAIADLERRNPYREETGQ